MFKCSDCGLFFDQPKPIYDTSDYCGHFATVEIGECCPHCGEYGFELARDDDIQTREETHRGTTATMIDFIEMAKMILS